MADVHPSVLIRFDENGLVFQPGETLSGEYRVDSVEPLQCKAVELSVLWYTEGKGDEDMAVHAFERTSEEKNGPIDVTRPGRFQVTLPSSPLSYDGHNLKIRWCVRVRLFPKREKELVAQKDFTLGAVCPFGVDGS